MGATVNGLPPPLGRPRTFRLLWPVSLLFCDWLSFFNLSGGVEVYLSYITIYLQFCRNNTHISDADNHGIHRGLWTLRVNPVIGNASFDRRHPNWAWGIWYHTYQSTCNFALEKYSPFGGHPQWHPPSLGTPHPLRLMVWVDPVIGNAASHRCHPVRVISGSVIEWPSIY